MHYPVMPPLPENPVYVVSTDNGNDVDDMFAVSYLARMAGDRIVHGTTTLYLAEQKAALLSLAYTKMGYPNIPVSSGYGFYHKWPATFSETYPWLQQKFSSNGKPGFLDVYPCWPKAFGIPGISNEISKHQAEAYHEIFKTFVPQFSCGTAVYDIIRMAKLHGNNLVIISQAPLTDIARAFELAPEIMGTINRIVMMGGWFNDRLGYNTAVDLWA
jgi:inosine-uridine nucleoside N-ribohydrolase